MIKLNFVILDSIESNIYEWSLNKDDFNLLVII